MTCIDCSDNTISSCGPWANRRDVIRWFQEICDSFGNLQECTKEVDLGEDANLFDTTILNAGWPNGVDCECCEFLTAVALDGSCIWMRKCSTTAPWISLCLSESGICDYVVPDGTPIGELYNNAPENFDCSVCDIVLVTEASSDVQYAARGCNEFNVISDYQCIRDVAPGTAEGSFCGLFRDKDVSNCDALYVHYTDDSQLFWSNDQCNTWIPLLSDCYAKADISVPVSDYCITRFNQQQRNFCDGLTVQVTDNGVATTTCHFVNNGINNCNNENNWVCSGCAVCDIFTTESNPSNFCALFEDNAIDSLHPCCSKLTVYSTSAERLYFSFDCNTWFEDCTPEDCTRTIPAGTSVGNICAEFPESSAGAIRSCCDGGLTAIYDDGSGICVSTDCSSWTCAGCPDCTAETISSDTNTYCSLFDHSSAGNLDPCCNGVLEVRNTNDKRTWHSYNCILWFEICEPTECSAVVPFGTSESNYCGFISNSLGNDLAPCCNGTVFVIENGYNKLCASADCINWACSNLDTEPCFAVVAPGTLEADLCSNFVGQTCNLYITMDNDNGRICVQKSTAPGQDCGNIDWHCLEVECPDCTVLNATFPYDTATFCASHTSLNGSTANNITPCCNGVLFTRTITDNQIWYSDNCVDWIALVSKGCSATGDNSAGAVQVYNCTQTISANLGVVDTEQNANRGCFSYNLANGEITINIAGFYCFFLSATFETQEEECCVRFDLQSATSPSLGGGNVTETYCRTYNTLGVSPGSSIKQANVINTSYCFYAQAGEVISNQLAGGCSQIANGQPSNCNYEVTINNWSIVRVGDA